MSYTTSSKLKVYLGIRQDLVQDDDLINTMIASAKAIIDSTVGFSFDAKADTERLFSWGQHVANCHYNAGERDHYRTLYFDTWLSGAPTEVLNGDGTQISPDMYVLLPPNLDRHYGLRLKRAAGVAFIYEEDPEECFKVTGKWGWSSTAPIEIEFACTRLAAFLYRQKDSQTFDQTAFSELGPIQMKAQIPTDVATILRRYIWRTSL